jgi:hypothetical protein
MKNYIKIGYEVIDGRMFLDLGTNQEKVGYMETLSVISGALAMVIRMAAENGPKNEGEVMRSVIDYLESEFVNPDSFKDLKVKRLKGGDKKG